MKIFQVTEGTRLIYGKVILGVYCRAMRSRMSFQEWHVTRREMESFRACARTAGLAELEEALEGVQMTMAQVGDPGIVAAELEFVASGLHGATDLRTAMLTLCERLYR